MYPRQVTDQLERAYGLALRLDQLGADPELIADCVGIDPSGVPSLIELAARKASDIANARSS